MNYTKGEWEVEHQNRRIFIGNGEVSICDITGSQDQEANAHLIAAAPELYEALRYLLDFLTMPTDEWVKQYGAGVTQKQACDKARGAIVKAETVS